MLESCFSFAISSYSYPPPDDIRGVGLPGGKGEFIGISRIFPGIGAYIRRVEWAAGGDG
jgi:hypothetical protein